MEHLNLHPWDAKWYQPGDYIAEASHVTQGATIDVHYPCPKDPKREHTHPYTTWTETTNLTSTCPKCCDRRTWVHIDGCVPFRAATA